MNSPSGSPGNSREQYWGFTALVSVALIFTGGKSPTLWLTICTTVWVVYVVMISISPLLIAASQDAQFARKTNRVLSILANIVTATLISTPPVMICQSLAKYPGPR